MRTRATFASAPLLDDHMTPILFQSLPLSLGLVTGRLGGGGGGGGWREEQKII